MAVPRGRHHPLPPRAGPGWPSLTALELCPSPLRPETVAGEHLLAIAARFMRIAASGPRSATVQRCASDHTHTPGHLGPAHYPSLPAGLQQQHPTQHASEHAQRDNHQKGEALVHLDLANTPVDRLDVAHLGSRLLRCSAQLREQDSESIFRGRQSCT